MEAFGVVPMHPPAGCELKVLDAPPRAEACWSADEFNLLAPIRCLRNGIVKTVTHGPDRRGRTDHGTQFTSWAFSSRPTRSRLEHPSRFRKAPNTARPSLKNSHIPGCFYVSQPMVVSTSP